MNGAPLPNGTPAPRPLAPVRLPIPAVPPRLTFAFIALNVIVFGAQLLGGWLLGGDRVLVWGAKLNQAIVAGEYWRLITPIFIHVSLLHLAINCYSLYIIGPQVEIPFGYARFLLIYLLSGVAGVVLSFTLSPNPSVGASGAIFGLVGALAFYLYRHRAAFGQMGRQRFLNLLIIIGINLAIGASAAAIDNWGHLGGLLAGAILGWQIGPEYDIEKDQTDTPRVADRNPLAGRWLAIAAVTIALVAATALTISYQR